ncbi:MAG: polyribonucleotide nucleotidyltransferase [Taibaiella sp.]|nr:polyribonucleotide nucleotidyltransferase [Taibaiella sp.]
MFNQHSVTFALPNGKEITIETGKLARQADGAVTVKCGNCVILATAVAAKEPKPGQSFFPLTVDYQEKFASAGRIPGSFHKREGRLNDYEVLISRLIDRALRPLFPEGYLCEVQILVSLISSDPEVAPDALACLAASAALAVSDIPISEIISEVRVAKIDDEFVVNPSVSEIENAEMDFLIGATDKNIMMVEGEAKECQEEDLIKAIETAHEAIKVQVRAQEELRDKAGITSKRAVDPMPENEEIQNKVHAIAAARINDIINSGSAKHERSDAFAAIKEEIIASFGEEPDLEELALAKRYFEDLQYYAVRNMILDHGKRLDGRDVHTVRPLDMEVDFLPSPHGSALFTRGETQSLTTVTLGTKDDELLMETAARADYNNFILHYNFPPFSTGETKPMRGPGRREVGHGNLAKRSLWQMMPKDYPYTVRIVSDILESNGSSSMATVCAGSLALMDAGVPVLKHVSGVAMGLISRTEDGKTAILTDILGDEDHLGDMDFKVTGTRDGICGVQMDIKIDGLSMDLMREALKAANKARMHILDAMSACMETYRPELKPQTPRIEQLIVDREFIGAIIGPGGKIIQEIQRTTNTEISIEEVGENGVVKVFSNNGENMEAAIKWIRGIVAIPEVGETYDATVKSLQAYGAFVEFMPGKQGLLHISEVSWKRLDTLEGILKEGDEIKVKLVGLDPKTGKFRLSRKVLMPKPEGYVEKPEREREPRRDGNRNGRNNNRSNDNRPQPAAPREESSEENNNE